MLGKCQGCDASRFLPVSVHVRVFYKFENFFSVLVRPKPPTNVVFEYRKRNCLNIYYKKNLHLWLSSKCASNVASIMLCLRSDRSKVESEIIDIFRVRACPCISDSSSLQNMTVSRSYVGGFGLRILQKLSFFPYKNGSKHIKIKYR